MARPRRNGSKAAPTKKAPRGPFRPKRPITPEAWVIRGLLTTPVPREFARRVLAIQRELDRTEREHEYTDHIHQNARTAARLSSRAAGTRRNERHDLIASKAKKVVETSAAPKGGWTPRFLASCVHTRLQSDGDVDKDERGYAAGTIRKVLSRCWPEIVAATAMFRLKS